MVISSLTSTLGQSNTHIPDIKYKVESCSHVHKDECTNTWMTLNDDKKEILSEYPSMRGINVQCQINDEDDKCSYEYYSKKGSLITPERRTSESNLNWMDETFDNYPDDTRIDYCVPDVNDIEYQLYNNAINVGSASNVQLSNECQQDMTVHEAKRLCNDNPECEGFYVSDINSPGNVCFKKNIINDNTYNPDPTNSSSVFFVKKKIYNT